MHYCRWKKFGSATVKLPERARNGKSTKSITINGKMTRYHRWLWEQHHGPIPKGFVVHHLNGDHFDNRIENLTLMSWGEHTRHHIKKWDRCLVNGCLTTTKTKHIHGLCRRHYRQWQTHGRITSVLLVPRGQRTAFRRPAHLRGSHSI